MIAAVTPSRARSARIEAREIGARPSIRLLRSLLGLTLLLLRSLLGVTLRLLRSLLGLTLGEGARRR